MPGYLNASPIYPCRGLICCPPYESTLSNPNFELATNSGAVVLDTWTLEAPGANGAVVSSGGFRTAKYYAMTPPSGGAGTPSLIYRYSAAQFAAIFGGLRPGTDYRLACAAACAVAGGGKLQLKVDVRNVAVGLIQSVTTEIVLGTDLPVSPSYLPDWRICRGGAINLTPDQAAAVSYIDLRLICAPVAGTYSGNVDLRLDFAAFGAMLDTNFLGRCVPDDPPDPDEGGLFDDEMSTARTGFRAAFHTTIPGGSFSVKGCQPGGETEPRNLLRAAGGGKKMSVMFDLLNLTRDYYTPVVHDGDTDGISAGVGAYFDVSIPFRGTV